MMTPLMWRGRVYAGVFALMCVSATGCRHRQTAVVLPIPPPRMLPVETTARTESQPLVQPVPESPVPLTTVIAVKKKVKKPKRVIVVTPPPAPAQVAAAAPEPNLIGALTAGGTDAQQSRQEAQELIGVLERRVNALPQKMKDDLRLQLMQVRNFQRAAQSSLSAGDAEGALTLATKAKLMLDDLLK